MQEFAREMQAVFEDIGVPIRVGGDEFIVWIRENNTEVIDKYMTTLADRVNEYNKKMNRPYQIGFSYGTKVFNEQYKDLQELVRHSDRMMYEEKQKKQIAH